MTAEFQPYVGPRPFDEEDKDLFFGRDAEANDLFSLIVAHPAVLVYAQSGAGKTSLLNAKIIPSLKREAYEVLPIARVQGIDNETAANIYVFNTLKSWADGQSAEPPELDQMSLAEFLRRRPHVQKVRDVAFRELDDEQINVKSQEMVEAQESPETPAIPESWELPRFAVFDQFEELFTSYPRRWEQRRGFFEQVREALDQDYLLRVVFMMREDYIAELDPYVSLLPGNLRVRVRLERLSEKSALEAVVRPLKFTNRKFEDGVARTLVQNLLKSSNGHGKFEQFVQAVQLQVVCQSLWQSLGPNDKIITMKHLEVCGDVNQALMRFYEKSIRKIVGANGLVDGDRRITEGDLRQWFEKVLITPEKKRATVDRRVEKTGGMPNDTVIEPLEKLQLLKGEWRASARWYELSHDRFIEPIITSNQKWLTEQSATEQIRFYLEGRATEYARGTGSLLNQDELLDAKRLLARTGAGDQAPSETLIALVNASRAPEHRRRMRLLSLGLFVLLVLIVAMSGLTIFAFQQRAEADRQRVAAEKLSQAAFDLTRETEKATEEAKSKALVAKSYWDLAEKEKAEAVKQATLANLAKADAVKARKEAELEKDLSEARNFRDREASKAENWNSYGLGLSLGGSFMEAIDAHSQALKIYENIKDSDGEAHSLTHLARVYSEQARTADVVDKQDKYAKAKSFYQQALEIRERISPESNELARAINYLAILYDDQDQEAEYVKAEQLYTRALEIRKRIFEKRDVGSLYELSTSYRNLSGLYQQQGRYSEAEHFAKKALEVLDKAPDPESRNVALADGFNLLGVIYYYQGRYAEAEPLYKKSLEINRRIRGSTHNVVASNLHNLALVSFAQAGYSQAKKLETEALGIYQQSRTLNREGMALGFMTFARIYRELGQFSQAEALYQQSVDEMIKAKGKEHRRVGILKHYQAHFYAGQGDYTRAQTIEEEALAIFKKVTRPDHWYVSRSLSTLATIHAGQRRETEAELLYKQAIENLKEKLGPNHPEVATSLADLTKLYVAQERYAAAEPLIIEALTIREKMGETHPHVADILENYAVLLQKTNREGEAKQQRARAEAIRNKFRSAQKIS